jgi:putative endonuclease
MNEAHELGKKGETLAKNYLSQKNITVLHSNWRWQKAEIDIIAEHNKQIVFIEVKTRRSSRFGNPSEFVSNKKQDLMRDAAEAYLEQHNLTNEIRFDIIGIILNSRNKTIEHIQNTF